MDKIFMIVSPSIYTTLGGDVAAVPSRSAPVSR
jgi:hypothetical protein